MAGLKHKLKLGLRDALARAFAYTPLGSLANRLAPPRLLILFGHCVDDTRYGGVLAPDMCLSERRFGEVLDALAKRGVTFDSIGGGWDRLQSSAPPRATVAVSMDDGYRDNAETMGPLLAARGISATVFLETRALDERRVNWTHHLHWLFDKRGAEETSLALAERARGLGPEQPAGPALATVVDEALALGGDAYYHVKRRLKYDVDPYLRDELLGELFTAHGGDEAALCEHLYMSWDQARGLAESGVELGGHTVSHAILSKLDEAGQAAEISGSVESMRTNLGAAPRVFAYPFGRRWDYDARTIEAVREAGCALAVNTHAGTNTKDSAPYELRRIAVEESSPLHLLLAEASGGFLLLERLGLCLSE
ncbi:MAG: polysaccharide deacetylase family protein [Planctomycetota bacterium]|nr:polysaccharide deacetylase family protein [Planctomycetota bacterium]